MIKYFTYNSHDEYGQHIIPVNSSQDLVKTASMNYSSEIANVIESMTKKPEMYYVVINALGSYEVWGINGNGDAFPRKGLNHLSLRSDLGTANDYGYKTFEYYAKLFKHHVNKPDSPSYGEVVFSHWNPQMDRVELIVGIDRFRAPDIVEALETGGNVAVSMGAKVRYDECSVCGNKAKTRAQYCKHAKGYLGKVIDEDTAAQWSRELGKEILPGTKVHAINEFPRFFDISKVHIGADRTAFVLGKAASDNEVIASVDVADAYGMTDELFDKIAEQGMLNKLALLRKKGEMDKRFGGGYANDMDGRAARISKAQMIAKALKEKAADVIEDEPEISNHHLDNVSSKFPIGEILKGLLSIGIMPKPKEFQRMVLGRAGHHRFADELENRGIMFNHRSCGRSIPFNGDSFGDTSGVSSMFEPMMRSRSFLPGMIEPRMNKIVIMIKRAGINPTTTDALEPIAAMYDGFKKYASKITPAGIAGSFETGTIANKFAGILAYLHIVKSMRKSGITDSIIDIPASDFETALIDTNFSGRIDYGRPKLSSQMSDSLILPSAYINASNEQSNVYYNTNDNGSDWMSKQSSLDSMLPQVINDIQRIGFNK